MYISYAACDRGNFHVAYLLLGRGYPVHLEHSWILLDPPQKLNDNEVSRKSWEEFVSHCPYHSTIHHVQIPLKKKQGQVGQ